MQIPQEGKEGESMKSAYVRRGDLLRNIPEAPRASVVAHEELLDTSELFWDAILPKEAKAMLESKAVVFEEVPGGYLSVGVLTHEKAKEIVDYWNEVVKMAQAVIDSGDELPG